MLEGKIMSNENQRHFVPSDVKVSGINEDGIVLMDVARDRMFDANITGARILQGLQEGKGVDVIVDELAVECSVPRHVVRSDAERFLASLKEYGLLRQGE